MTLTVNTPTLGRGAWSPVGGTLDITGSKPGQYYRAPSSGRFEQMPGNVVLSAKRSAAVETVSVNDYAVWAAVKFIQRLVGATVDGCYGLGTAKAVAAWQTRVGLVGDGVWGPLSATYTLNGIVARSVREHGANSTVAKVTWGHLISESNADPGAVGYGTPDDLGCMQINGRNHPDMDMDERFDPDIAIKWGVEFVMGNIAAMGGNVNDGIAAYNLGRGGAGTWVKQGRPRYYVISKDVAVDVWSYINRVRTNGGLPAAYLT